MSSPSPESSSPKITSEQLAEKARLVSECMLSNYACTIVGVAVGTFLGIRRKHLRPFVYAITIGTFGDIFYAYTNSCRPVINDYERAKRSIAQPKEKWTPKDPSSVVVVVNPLDDDKKK